MLDVFMITTGSMIAAGLFVLPGIAFARTGPSVVLAYGIAALIALPTILSAAELSTAMPRAGGIYFFVSRGIGYGAGSLAGFARWLSISLKCAYALLGIGIYSYVFTGVAAKFTAVIVCLIFIFLNLAGIKLVGIAQVILTSVLICVLTYLAVGGIASINLAYFEPFSPEGFGSILSTAGFIFISYGGMLAITGLAEEVKRPRRNIPLGMILGLIFTGLIYTIVVFVIVGNLEASVLINTLTPVADTAGIAHGRIGVLLASLAALLAFVTTANAGIASASRYPLAMSRDRLLPNLLLRSHFNNGMPAVSILFTGFLILVAIIFLELEALVEIASSLLMLTYILTNLTVIILKYKVNNNYQPTFHAPLKPWLQALSIAGLLLLITQVSFMAIIVSIIFCLAAYSWYLLKAKQLPDNIIPLPPKPKNRHI